MPTTQKSTPVQGITLLVERLEAAYSLISTLAKLKEPKETSAIASPPLRSKLLKNRSPKSRPRLSRIS
jgi:hypothetical protein